MRDDRRRVSRRGVLVAIVIGACLTSGCEKKGARALAGRVKLGDPMPKPETEFPVTEPIEIEAEWLRIVRLPRGWQIDRKPRGEGETKAWFVVTGYALGPVRFWVEPTGEDYGELAFIPEQHVIGYVRGTFLGKPFFEPNDLLQKYPSDRDFAIAFTKLEPGDPARGRRALTRREQEACVLSLLCQDIFGGGYVPTLVDYDKMEAFVGGSDLTSSGDLLFTLWIFDKDSGRRGLVHVVFPRETVVRFGQASTKYMEFLTILGGCLESKQNEKGSGKKGP